MVLNQIYTYEEIFQDVKNLSETYSDFTTFRIIGYSHDHRPIPLLRIGLGIETLVLTAGIHGRDAVNPILFLQMAEEYCKSYQENTTMEQYDVQDLLNRCSICFLPLLNPDGYEIALHGFDILRNPILRQLCKMREIDHNHWKYNAHCVDINRNFPCKSYIQQQIGEYPASEPETRALMKVFEEYETVGYLNFQSRGRIIYYYRHAMPFSYNQKNYRLARFMQKISDYNIGKKEEEFYSRLNGGTPVNYYSELFKNPALTIETIEPNAEYPLKPEYQKDTYEEIRSLPLEIIEKL